MLDQKFCSSPTLFWTTFTSDLSDILFTPKVIVVMVVLFLGIYFLFRKSRQKLPLSIVISSLPLLFSLLLTSSPFIEFANSELVKFPIADSNTHAEAIVILGRGVGLRESRVKVASQLWRSQRAPRIFVSGRGDATEMQEMLGGEGIPREIIGSEDCSRTTEENAEFTALELQPLGVRTILLVTDPPHMQRSLLIFRHYGFKAMAAPSATPPELPKHTRVLLIIREYLAINIYRLKGGFDST